MDKVVFLLVGYLINAVLLYVISKCIKDFNLLKWIGKYLPKWLNGIVSIVLLAIGGFLSVCMIFRFGGLVYEAINESDMVLLVKYIITDIVCVFYFYAITNKLMK